MKARIAALGEWRRIQALAVAGVEAYFAETEDQVIAEWTALPEDVAVLVVTKHAADALRDRLEERRKLLVTVLP